MKIAVLLYPGSNRDRDMIAALTCVAGTPPIAVWHTETDLPACDLLVLPGGFSFGDYLRCGAIAARSPITRELVKQADAGVPVLGVCNGFQILTETGLLPGALMRNAGLAFICKHIHLRVETTSTLFTGSYNVSEVIRCPVAHHDGNYTANAELLKRLNDEDRVAFRYCDRSGDVSDAANPNGSQESIAGILSENRRILGMMPHPENLIEELHGGTDGRRLFESVVEAVAA